MSYSFKPAAQALSQLIKGGDLDCAEYLAIQSERNGYSSSPSRITNMLYLACWKSCVNLPYSESAAAISEQAEIGPRWRLDRRGLTHELSLTVNQSILPYLDFITRVTQYKTDKEVELMVSSTYPMMVSRAPCSIDMIGLSRVYNDIKDSLCEPSDSERRNLKGPLDSDESNLGAGRASGDTDQDQPRCG